MKPVRRSLFSEWMTRAGRQHGREYPSRTDDHLSEKGHRHWTWIDSILEEDWHRHDCKIGFRRSDTKCITTIPRMLRCIQNCPRGDTFLARQKRTARRTDEPVRSGPLFSCFSAAGSDVRVHDTLIMMCHILILLGELMVGCGCIPTIATTVTPGRRSVAGCRTTTGGCTVSTTGIPAAGIAAA